MFGYTISRTGWFVLWVLSLLFTWQVASSMAVAPEKPKPERLMEAEPPSAGVVSNTKPFRDHNYDSQDGIAYGYTTEISQAQREQGQAAASVIMVEYAGSKGDKHQVHTRKGNVLTAFECAPPCEVIKVMTVIDSDYLRNQVNIEHIRAQPNTIAALALEDAIKGKLRQYSEYHGDNMVGVWVDGVKGIQRTKQGPRPKQ